MEYRSCKFWGVAKIKPPTARDWVNEIRKQFAVGDKVMGKPYGFCDKYKGVIEGVYEHYVLVAFDVGFRQCFGWHSIKEGFLIPRNR